MALLFFLAPFVSMIFSHNYYVFRNMWDGLNEILYVFSAVFGCTVGAVSVSRFGRGRKGDIFRTLPVHSTVSFVSVSLCELLKALMSTVICFAAAVILEWCIMPKAAEDMWYFWAILGECICYIVLYFAVGIFFAAISGRWIPAVLGGLSYYLGSGLICYTVAGVDPYLPRECGGFLSLICAPFLRNAPFFKKFYYVYKMYGDEHAPIEAEVFNDALCIFGMLFSAAAFYLLGVAVFKYRKVESLGEPYCFPIAAPLITSALTLECYFLAVISPWSGIEVSVELVSGVFGVGKILPGTEYAAVFIISFFVFSALTNCSPRHIFKYLKLLPALAVATYIFQCLWLKGVL